MKKIGLTFGSIILLTWMGCASTAPAARSTSPEAQGPTSVEAETFFGSGKSPSLLTAMNQSKLDAVRKYLVGLMGEQQVLAQETQLNEAIFSTNRPNQFVQEDTMETLRRDKVGEDYIYEIKIRVDVRAVKNTLQSRGIAFPGSDPSRPQTPTTPSTPSGPVSPTGPVTTPTQPAVPVDLDIQEGDYEEVTAEEARFIRRYVDRLTYMVYFNEAADMPPAIVRAGIARANRYFTENTMNVVDFDQIEKVKEDQRMVFEEETGYDVPFIQWLAQELNSDIYVELDFSGSSESPSSNRHFAQVAGSLKLFDPSTGFLLGTVPLMSQRTMNPVSADMALRNAMEGAMWEAMPKVVAQSKAYMVRAMSRGLRYEVVIQNSFDSRLMSNFRRRLTGRVKDLDQVSATPTETKYAVYFVGSITELEDLIYDISESIGGLEGMYGVFTRGRTITFNTGL